MAASGEIQGFNYKEEVMNNRPNHIANLNYAICIRMESGFCGIRYSQVDAFAFTLTGAADAITATTTLGNADVKYGDSQCSTDYLIIAGGSETGSSSDLLYSKDRFCGTALGYCKEGITAGTCTPQIGAVVSFTKPFIVGVVTNDNELATSTSNRGFKLLYSQQPCLSAG